MPTEHETPAGSLDNNPRFLICPKNSREALNTKVF
jgi:hypothetical protein